MPLKMKPFEKFKPWKQVLDSRYMSFYQISADIATDEIR